MSRRTLGPALAAAAALLVAAAPAHAGIWAPVPSGTTADISAVEYQAADRFWFATRTGEIYKRQADGTFARTHGPTAIPLNDIEFLPAGGLGFAVGNNGQVLRTTNGGESWSEITGIPVSRQSTPVPDCTGSEPLGNVNSVRFAGASAVYLFARGAQIARSTANNLGAQNSWTDANRDRNGTPNNPADDTCKVAPESNAGIADAFFATPSVGYVTTAHFGQTFFTADGLGETAAKQPALAGNGQLPNRRMTGDPARPNRMWAVGPGGADLSYTAVTVDGWGTASAFVLGNPGARAFAAPRDVDYAGGTVLVVGDEGLVLNSVDGRTFFHNEADGAPAGTAWLAASLASGRDAAIGGSGGALAVSGTANQLPPSAPPAKVLKTPNVNVRASYFRPRRSTRFTRIAITGVPRGAKVVARCLKRSGRRCGTKRLRRAFVRTDARRTVRIRRFERRALRAGTRIDIAVSHPDYVTQIKIITVRRNRLPLISTRCRRPEEPRRTRC